MAPELDVDYQGIFAPGFPAPLLYVSTTDARGTDYLIPTVKRYGLPILRLEGPEDAAVLSVDQAVGEEWRIVIGPGRAITVQWPFSGGAFVRGTTMSTVGWREAALQAGEAMLIVGPPLEWTNEATIENLIEVVWKAGGAAGVVRVAKG